MATYGTIHSCMKLFSLMSKCLKRTPEPLGYYEQDVIAAPKTELPQTETQMESWLQAIFALGKFEDTTQNRASLCRALMHAPNDVCEMPIQYFITSLKRSHAQFAAFEEIERCKIKDKAEEEAKASRAQEGHEHDTPVAHV